MMGEKDFEAIRQYLTDVAIIVPVEEIEVVGDLGVDYYIGVRPDTPSLKNLVNQFCHFTPFAIFRKLIWKLSRFSMLFETINP